MKHQEAVITVEKSEMVRAITAHLATVLLTQTNVSDDFEPNGSSVKIQVDGKTEKFSILHIVTDFNQISGIVLVDTVFDEDETEGIESNTLKFIVIKIRRETEFTVGQRVYEAVERDVVAQRNKITRSLVGYVLQLI